MRFDFRRHLPWIAASVLAIIALHHSMPSMPELPMPGGWMLSSMWTPLCGRTWLRAAASFAGMWIAMMTAMMLPSVAPILHRKRLPMQTGAGYLAAWTVFGLLAFAAGAIFASMCMRMPALARAVPTASGAMVVAAGLLQSSEWKARRLGACHGMSLQGGFFDGLRFGWRCMHCCAPLTIVLFAAGAMHPLAMIGATLAISAERLAHAPATVARITGVLVIALGTAMLLHAAHISA
jgi:predicted metal-binding membrane protein